MLFGKKIWKMPKNIRRLAKNVGKYLKDTHKQQQLVLAQGQHTTNVYTLAYIKTHYYARSA